MKILVTTFPARCVVSQTGPVTAIGRAATARARAHPALAMGRVCIVPSAVLIRRSTFRAGISLVCGTSGSRVPVRVFEATWPRLWAEGRRIGVNLGRASGRAIGRPRGGVCRFIPYGVKGSISRSVKTLRVFLAQGHTKLHVVAMDCSIGHYPLTIHDGAAVVGSTGGPHHIIVTPFSAVAPQLNGQSLVIKASAPPAPVSISLGGTPMRVSRAYKMVATPRRVYVGSAAHN